MKFDKVMHIDRHKKFEFYTNPSLKSAKNVISLQSFDLFWRTIARLWTLTIGPYQPLKWIVANPWGQTA